MKLITEDDFDEECTDGTIELKILVDKKQKAEILKNQEILEHLKELNFKGHIDFLEHYLKAMPIMYDKAKLEVILWDWKELQKILGEKN